MKAKIKIFIFCLITPCSFLSFKSLAAEGSANDFTKISTTGFVNFSASTNNQSSDFEKQKLPDGSRNYVNSNQSLGSDSQIYIKSEGAYGAAAKIKFIANSNRKLNPNFSQAFLFSDSDFGKFELGNAMQANEQMKAGPAKFARGAGGINGKYLEYVNLPTLQGTAQTGSTARLPSFILLAQSPIGHGGYAKSFYNYSAQTSYNTDSIDYGAFNKNRLRTIKDTNFDGVDSATKINFYSKRISGLQLAASYAPDSANNGFTRSFKDTDSIRIKNIFSFGANYLADIDNVSISASATAEKGKVSNSQSSDGASRNDLFSYDTGFSVSYFGFTAGFSYGFWGNSLQPKSGIYSNDNQKSSGANYYTTGIAYKFGPAAASVTSIRSKFQNNNYNAISFGVDYKIVKNLTTYFELTKFDFKSNQLGLSQNQSIIDNKGNVVLTGILLSF